MTAWALHPLSLHGPLFEGAIRVYGEAFARPPYNDNGRGKEIRARLLDLHGDRAGFRGFVALEAGERERGDVPVGMIYGYHGERGQWWHDAVLRVLAAGDGDCWLGDSYELVELAVHPDRQGRGIGTALVAALLAGRPERTCMLSTRCDSRAHELYRRLGFEEVCKMPFVPRGQLFYIMGKRLTVPDESPPDSSLRTPPVH